jgi:methoxymalonate biosynthesis protein
VIKCVIWDLDNTLLDGVYLESPDQRPTVNPRLAAVLAELAGRGILQAIASRNPPEAGRYAEQVTGHAFASAQLGWGAKSEAVRAVLAELGLTADEVAFVDDDALERAEVSFALPQALVLEPRDMADAAGWPQFSPPVITEEGRRRGELYAQRRVRQAEAQAFDGSVAEFLRRSGTRVRIAAARPADVPRLHELSVRTHQFNSTGRQVSGEELAGLLGAAGHRVITVWLSDKYGDDGLVGGCVIATQEVAAGWRVTLLMMSCRAIGRSVIDALLAWIGRAAGRAGADRVVVPCVINDRNVPLRIALTGAGFRADGPARAGTVRTADYARPLDRPLPELPDWVTAC